MPAEVALQSPTFHIPLQLKMWSRVVVWCLVVSAASSRHNHQWKTTRTGSQLIIDTSDKGGYSSYSKGHPGRHVCSLQKALPQQVKTLQSYCKPAFKPYTQRCLDNQNCNGVRLVYETAYRTVYETRMTRHTSYVCCPGWTQVTKIDHGCNEAICIQLCQNGGSCIKPDSCVCLPGYTGKQCETDIDECLEKPCDHTCINTNGSFECQCHDGFDLLSDGRTCRSHEGKVATEARDLLDYDILAKRVLKLEKVMVSHSSEYTTDETMSELKNKVRLAIENIAQLRRQLSEIERHQNEYHQQLESLKPYTMEVQRINTLSDQVLDMKRTLSECNCRRFNVNDVRR